MSQQPRSGRPPMEIRSPQQQQPPPQQQYEEGPQPGGLSYQAPPRQYVPQQQYAPAPIVKSGGSFVSALIVGVIVLLISIYAGTMLSASKADMTAALKPVQDNMATLTATVNADKTSLNNLITSVGATYATKAEVNSVAKPDLTPYALKTDIKAFDLTTIDFSTLTAAQITALKTKLGTSTATGSSSSGVVTTTGGTVDLSVYTGPSQGQVYAAGTYIWYLQFINNDTAYHKVQLIASMTPSTTYSYTGMLIPPTTMQWTLPTTSTVTTFSSTFIPTTLAITTSANFVSTDYLILSPGQKIIVPTTLTLTYSGGGLTFWNMNFTPSVLSYP